MNPLLWWWRWWSRVISPNRDEALVKAQKAIEEQRAKADRLSSELEAKDAEIAALQARLSQAERTASPPEPQAAPQRRAVAEPLAEPLAAPEPQAVLEPQAVPQPQAVPDAPDVALPEPQIEPDSGAPEPRAAPKQPESKPASPPDVSTATEVLGTRIRPNDLTVIEGIGPKIADLLSNAGFSTWHALSEADTDDLRRVLQEAGPRFRIHDPAKWPPQAALLAQGQWQEYKELRTKIRSRSS